MPMRLARGTLRTGSRTTPAAAAAHSRPRKAKKAVSAEGPTAAGRLSPSGFQEARKTLEWKASQPRVAAITTGARPTARVAPSTRVTALGPIQAAATASQTEARVSNSRGPGPARAGARYPTAPATAMATGTSPIQQQAQ